MTVSKPVVGGAGMGEQSTDAPLIGTLQIALNGCRAAMSTSWLGTGVLRLFSTCTSVAATACAALGARRVRSNPASTTEPVPIKKDFANLIDFLRLCLALCAGFGIVSR